MQTGNEDHVNELRQDHDFWIRCKQFYERKCTSLKKGKNKAHYHRHGRLEGSRESCINLSAAYRGQFPGTKH